MFSSGIIDLLKKVISSWEVIAITIVFILYVFLVNHAARKYRRPRVKKSPSVKKTKPKPEGGKKKGAASKSNDELGLEEK